MQAKQEEHHFLLFVNSKSGGRKGMQYLTMSQNRIKFKSKRGCFVYVYFYDLFDSARRQSGFQNVLNLCKVSKNVNLIICGGDGTVLWVIKQAVKAGIDLENVYFGIIPIGTGNDFSRSLGWGGSPINCNRQNIRQLRKIIQKWLQARKQKFDLWDAQISTYQGGKINISSSNVQSQNKNVMYKTFSNYLGIGIDARVSYYFEKNRTQSKFLNLSLYGCIGLICCLKRTQKMHNAITEFSQSQSEGYNSSDNQQTQKQMCISETEKKNIQLLQTSVTQSLNQLKLKKGYTGIVCLNCTSYMSGVKNVFKSNRIAARNRHNKDFVQQKFDDGIIQFVGFKNQLQLGLERIMHTAGKICQGAGPFTLKFSPKKQQQTFVQIDGQAVSVLKLKQIRISKSKLIPSSKINVLVNRQDS